MAATQPNSAGRRQAEDAFWASVPGHAVRAYERGDQFFSYDVHHQTTTGRSRTDTLARIEAAGWRLEHASWVNEPDGSVLGIHLFRRDDNRPDRVTGPTAAPTRPAATVLRLHTD